MIIVCYFSILRAVCHAKIKLKCGVIGVINISVLLMLNIQKYNIQ